MKNILTIAKRFRNPFEKLGHSPQNDWHFALACAAIGLALAIVIDVTLFVILSAPEANPKNTDSLSSLGISKTDISAAIESIDKKERDALLVPMDIRIDPSR